MFRRTLLNPLARIVEEYGKMAFVSGPRQVGKTTLALEYQKAFGQGSYFNWDVITDQKKLLKDPYFFEKADRDPVKPFIVILDEIHKFRRWKNYLKGAYDRYHNEFRFVVTGSGRLDFFKKGGDSLLGRYLPLPLMPLTLGELKESMPTWKQFLQNAGNPPPESAAHRENQETLLRFSGFPEPFSRAQESFYNVWFAERKKLLIREDIQGTFPVREVSLLESLSHLIPERVGNPLSINSLREDVQIAFETARDWVELLAQFYYLFRVRPFAGSLSRTLKKEAKVYLYDWVEVPDAGFRFENYIALHLYKAVQLWRATGAGPVELFYVRDKEKQEVDFLLTERNKPLCLIECKLSDENPAPALLYFQRKLKVPLAVQLVSKEGVCKKIRLDGGDLWIISSTRWLPMLP